MKKIVLSLVVLLLGSASAFAFSWGDLRDEFQEEVRLTVLQGANPVYLYNMRKGQSEGGIETNVFWYRFISADLGWANPYDANKKGTILGGASLHIDKLIAQSFPTFSTFASAFIPGPAQNFWDKVFIGFYFGRNIDDEDLDFGLKSGLEFKF